MQWLRKLLSGSAEAPKANSSAFRPNLETLDTRDLPSVSSVLTAGGLTQFIVDNTNSLLVKINGAAAATVIQGTTTTGVRTAQGFRTAGGGLGFDAVMTDGTFQHFEQGNNGLLPNGTYSTSQINNLPAGSKFLDVGTAYDSQGRLRLDMLVTSPGNTSVALGQTGRLFEFNQVAGGGVQEVTGLPNVRWVSAYTDVNGFAGIAVGQQFANGELLVRKGDSTGVSTLYDGDSSITAAITDYVVTATPITNVGSLPGVPNNVLNTTGNAATRREVIDITFNSNTAFAAGSKPGTYAIEYSVTPSVNLAPLITTLGIGVGNGPDNALKPGG